MRILMLTGELDPRLGGIGTFSRELATAASEKHEVVLVAPDYGQDNDLWDAGRPFEIWRYPGGVHTFRDIGRKIALVRSISRRKDHWDVVHAIDYPFFTPLALSRFPWGGRCIATLHGSDILFMSHPVRSGLLTASGFWKRPIELHANSRFTLDLLAKRFPQSGSHRTFVEGLGVSADWLSGRMARSEARARIDIAPSRFVILTVGRIVPRKGHHVLAATLSRLPDAVRQKISWLIVGPEEDEAYSALVKARVAGLGADVRFLGRVSTERLQTIYDGADLFSMLTTWDGKSVVEGFGLVYLEAAARGVPSLAADVGGVSDAVEDGVTGVLVPQNDPAAAEQEIVRLFENPVLLRKMSEEALAMASRRLWSNVAGNLYDERHKFTH